eukprot:GHVT01099229.1.p1 GENE.GHVT01099229.1~~GHVT01099229.1.p1  ORF type:complete len:340 (-),score=-13.70 GHVT01099229.1:509-1528(-)
MKLDTLFKLLVLLVVGFTLPHFRSMKEQIVHRQLWSTTYPCLYDLWRCGVVALIIGVVERLLKAVLRPVADSLIPHGKWSPKVRELKVARFGSMAFRTIYFLCVSIWAYVNLRDEVWFPAQLGGVGDVSAYWIDYPLQVSSNAVHWYFYANGGYQLYHLVSLLLAPPMPDFWETVLQHVCALLLISFSYMANYLRVGAIIMFCHDVCDIFSFGCKLLVDTPFKRLTISLFMCLLAFWGYLRLYCYPATTLYPILMELHSMIAAPEIQGWMWFVFLLSTVMLMDIYWFALMLKIFGHFVTSGQTTDMHSRVSEVDLRRGDSTPSVHKHRTTAPGSNKKHA